ncbi:MAG: hypothetical protein LBF00_03070 [Mycoplasmataceae bacterium]|jgi:cytochrome oxidase Cu insertion factor (SCO1/SenC/PrrC family)|nr:hypothetical protein [Mycoplasmataceae bacterium]
MKKVIRTYFLEFGYSPEYETKRRLNLYLYENNSTKVSITFKTKNNKNADIKVKTLTEFCKNIPVEEVLSMRHEINRQLKEEECSDYTCYDGVSDYIYDEIDKIVPITDKLAHLTKRNNVSLEDGNTIERNRGR